MSRYSCLECNEGRVYTKDKLYCKKCLAKKEETKGYRTKGAIAWGSGIPVEDNPGNEGARRKTEDSG